ncbi:hypothetical protein CsSME_00015494 [Camellia sinensis var. sinensis]
MAANRVGVLFVFIVCVCPLNCKAADYMTCDSTGEERLSPPCNCCLAGKGCTIYYPDGTSAIC